MRVNVYGEELTDKVEIIHKEAKTTSGTIEQFKGVRLYLKSHPDLHHSAGDNDESAITIWVPWTKAHGHDCIQVAALLRHAAELVEREF